MFAGSVCFTEFPEIKSRQRDYLTLTVLTGGVDGHLGKAEFLGG